MKIVLVGDSTVNDGGGWGPGFRAAFGPDVEIVNLALNGRSSKSFRDEGAWAPALAAKPAYILIQFGHNDCPGKGPERETDPNTTFRANLIRYMEEAEQVGAHPVLITSIVRRVFVDGKIKPDCLVPFVEQVRTLARDRGVPMIDLYELTRRQSEELGMDGSAALGARTKDGKLDTTHLGPKGQESIGAMAAAELLKVVPALRKYAKPRQEVSK